MVKELIKAGANLDLQDNEGFNALMLASNNTSNYSYLEVVKELIKAGANIDLQNKYCDTCLSFLVKYSNSLEIIIDLISRGLSVNNLTKNTDINNSLYKYNGNSLLHWCAIGIMENTSSYQILGYLETLGIDKSLKNQEGKTYYNYIVNVKYYHVSNECSICYQNSEYITILNCECSCGKVCVDCSKLIGSHCPYCRKYFTNIQIFRFI